MRPQRAPREITWEQAILNVITLYDAGRITQANFANGIWGFISEATKIEREVNAQIAENMGSYVIAEEIRKGE